ncbi:hypothetical protein AAF712_002908 [Marasmius tenuissimus]|uniref:Ribosome assembly protein 3 n=1 Tax=Marasmius tenuissimus TaxID=585030 RepID=A0ABR3A7N9_9AGAR
MAAAAAKPAVPRKRNRKRKRRADFSSSFSSSSSSDPDSESDTEKPGVAVKVTRKVAPTAPAATTAGKKDGLDGPSSSSESSASSSEESDSDDELQKRRPRTQTRVEPGTHEGMAPIEESRARSASPPPPSTAIPSFLEPQDGQTSEQREQEMRDKFRKFWMSAVADGFKDDLEEIRKEPNLTTSKLSLLIESLASGADLFSATEKNGVNEMEILIG